MSMQNAVANRNIHDYPKESIQIAFQTQEEAKLMWRLHQDTKTPGAHTTKDRMADLLQTKDHSLGVQNGLHLSFWKIFRRRYILPHHFNRRTCLCTSLAPVTEAQLVCMRATCS